MYIITCLSVLVQFPARGSTQVLLCLFPYVKCRSIFEGEDVRALHKDDMNGDERFIYTMVWCEIIWLCLSLQVRTYSTFLLSFYHNIAKKGTLDHIDLYAIFIVTKSQRLPRYTVLCASNVTLYMLLVSFCYKSSGLDNKQALYYHK